jgi:hypothetical protein
MGDFFNETKEILCANHLKRKTESDYKLRDRKSPFVPSSPIVLEK